MGALISTIITTIISAVGLSFSGYLNYNVINTPDSVGTALSMIVIIPLIIILYITLFGLLLSSLITSIRGMFKSSKAIKIMSIIFFILTIALIVLYVIFGIQFLKIIKG